MRRTTLLLLLGAAGAAAFFGARLLLDETSRPAGPRGAPDAPAVAPPARRRPVAEAPKPPPPKPGSPHAAPPPASQPPADPNAAGKERETLRKEKEQRIESLLAEAAALAGKGESTLANAQALAEAVAEYMRFFAPDPRQPNPWRDRIAGVGADYVVQVADALERRQDPDLALEAILLLHARFKLAAEPRIAQDFRDRTMRWAPEILQNAPSARVYDDMIGALGSYLSLFNQDAFAVDTLTRAFAKAGADSRNDILVALGNSRSPHAVPFLKAVLADPETRSLTIWALRNFSREQVGDLIPALLEAVRGGDSRAAETLARLGVREGADYLVGQITESGAGPLWDIQSAATLARYGGTPDPAWIARVREALLRTGTGALLGASRYNAAAVLGYWGDASGIDLLRQSQTDASIPRDGPEDWYATSALAKLGDAPALSRIRAWARGTGNPHLTTAAQQLLAELRQ